MLPIQDVQDHENINHWRRKRMILIMIGVWGLLAVLSLLQETQVKKNTINKSTVIYSECQNIQMNVLDKLIHNNPPNLTLAENRCFSFKLLQGLLYQHFRGQWSNVKGDDGKFFLQTTPISQTMLSLRLFYFDGQYLDDPNHSVLMIIDETKMTGINYNEEKRQIEFNNYTSQVNSQKLEENINMDMNITFEGFQHYNITNLNQGLMLNICLQSNWNDQLIGIAKISTIDYQHKTFLYSCYVSLIVTLQIICALRVLKKVFEQSSLAENYSLITLSLITTQDSFLSLLHFYFGMSLEHLITPAFLYFMLFSLFEMRLIILIWRLRQDVQFDNNMLRISLVKFYLLFYSLMFITILLFYNYSLSSWLLILQSLILVPQIVHTAMKGQIQDSDMYYSSGLVAINNQQSQWYYKGCPSNIFEFRPNEPLCIIITILMGIQLITYYYQGKKGARFFIPKFLLPKRYNYFIALPESFDLEVGPTSEIQSLFREECSVCMVPLHETPVIQLNDIEMRNQQLKQMIQDSQGQIMKTPCNHKFHSLCLSKWMTIKMNCPSCRSQLPAL